MNIADFKDKHKGDDIYILASGKSCDFMDMSFLDGKIVLGVNNVFKKFRCDYSVFKEFAGKHVFEQDNVPIIFYTRDICGGGDKKNKNILNSYNLDAKITDRCVEITNYGQMWHTTDKKRLGNIFQKSDKFVCTFSTISTAIHLAFFMGAKNIILVGHDGCSIGGENNFTGYHTKQSLSLAWGNNEDVAKKRYKQWVQEITKTTVAIQQVLGENHNVNVVSLTPFVSLKHAASKIDT